MNRIFIVFVFFVFYHGGIAQQQVIDEIVTKLDSLKTDEDSIKIAELRNLSIPIVQNNDLESNIGPLLKAWGKYYERTFAYDSSIFYFTKRVNYYENTGDSLELASAYYSLAGSYTDIDEFVYSASLYLKSLALYEKIGNSKELGETFNALANNYYYSGDSKIAIGYYKKAIDIFESSEGMEKELSMVLGNIAAMHAELKLYDVAETYYTRAIEIIEGKEYPRELIGAYLGMGIVKEELKEYNKAYQYYKNAYDLAVLENDILQIGFALQSFGYYYLAIGKYDSAEWYGNKALQFSEKVNSSLLRQNSYEILHDAYYNLSKYKQAYDYLKVVRTETDSLYDLSSARQLNAIQAQYETEKKEVELAKQRELIQQNENQITRQNLLRNFLYGLLSLFVVIMVLIFRNQKLQNRANRILKVKNTEIASQRDHIQMLEKAKSKWFINISHELKTPLTLIKGPVDQLINKSGMNDDDLKKLQLASRNLKVLDTMIHEILDLSNFESGNVNLNKSVFDLVKLASQTLESFSSFALVNEVKLTFSYPLSEPIYISADYSKLSKLISNLISNAIKFTQADGQVEMILTENRQFVVIKVKDNGKGISDSDLPHIFNRFYQVNDPNFTTSGSGIGLSICKEITDLHGGSIQVTSSLGLGSEFEVLLPTQLKVAAVNTEDNLLEIKQQSTIALNSSQIKEEVKQKIGLIKRILLVDDNPDMRVFIQSILASNYVVQQVMDGREAMNHLEKYEIDLIIADIMMPKMDGNQLASKIKEHSKWKSIPFITLSAMSDQQTKIEFLRAGVDDYLIKPFDPRELIARIVNLLENAEHRKNSNHKKEDGDVSFDDKIMAKLTKEVHDNISDSDYKVEKLASAITLSEIQLDRYLSSATGLTPANFIKEIRLQQAFELARVNAFKTVAELSYAVGFQHPSYFIKVFEARFGRRPTDIMKK